MSTPNGIVVVTQEPQTARAVSGAAESADQNPSPRICRDLEELVQYLERAPAFAVVIDIDPWADELLDDLDPIISRFAATTFIVLAKEQRDEWLLQAMRVGARHLLPKDRVPSDLPEVLRRLSQKRASVNGSVGSVVTVLSAGGGCGATTLAINLAHELHLLSSEPSLLIDMDCAYGGAAGYLGTTAEFGVADVLADGDRLDAQLIRSTAVEHNDRLHLLVSPATVNLHEPADLNYRVLGQALQNSKEAFSFTVVDAPRVPMSVAETLARASLRTFIVFEMNVGDVRMARAIFQDLTNRGVPQERLLLLANRYCRRNQMISLSEVTKALGTQRIECLSNDYRNVVSSINYGKPLAEDSPRSPLCREIRKLAGAVHEVVAPRQACPT